jgi:deoxyribonuclease-1-like protein
VWKPIAAVLVVALAGGLYYFTSHYEVKREDGRIVIHPLPVAASAAPSDPTLPPPQATRKTIRIATFNLGPLDRNKLGNALIVGHLAELIRDFDVVAVQNIQAANRGAIQEFVDQINSSGRYYDFAISDEVGVDPTDRYNAFLFDKTSVEIDRSTVCLVNDPAGRFRWKPVVALFRARGPAPKEAFTFLLINAQVDPERADVEIDLLDDAVAAVRKNRPDEDDVILLGDLETNPRDPRQLANIPNVAWAISDTVSTTRGTQLADNLLFDRRATVEFTGRANVIDLVRRLNLNIEDALMVAEHMPVWAEFSIYEGGQAGYVGR